MKRHDSLIPLSRFHRSCLFLALIAKPNAPTVKGYPTELAEKIDYAIAFYQKQLIPHFDLEAKLWRQVATKSTVLSDLVQCMKEERQALIESFETLRTLPSEGNLNKMGQMLEAHIRKEERVLFQQIQQDLTEEELNDL
jgi:iron-sulfur cluster repair protein YtfE (RIC family)